MIVKIGLKQKDNEEKIIVKALLDSRAIGLVMSSEFARKNKFKKKNLERLIYMRNINGTFNYKELIKHTVEVKLFYKERTEINIIRNQKWSVILEIPWLACHNSEINWKTEEVKITICLDKYGKQLKAKQMKPVWQKQKEKE